MFGSIVQTSDARLNRLPLLLRQRPEIGALVNDNPFGNEMRIEYLEDDGQIVCLSLLELGRFENGLCCRAHGINNLAHLHIAVVLLSLVADANLMNLNAIRATPLEIRSRSSRVG